MSNSLPTFPFKDLLFGEGCMGSQIQWNPYCEMPPNHAYSLYLPYTGGPEGEEESELELDMIAPIESGSWDDQIGERSWSREDRYGDGSVYIDGRHHPVDILNLCLTRLVGTRFQIKLRACIDFSFEGGEYENSDFEVEAEVEFSGTSISIPVWGNPEEVVIPDEWDIPSDWTEISGKDFASRFIDLRRYQEPVLSEHSVMFAPKAG